MFVERRKVARKEEKFIVFGSCVPFVRWHRGEKHSGVFSSPVLVHLKAHENESLPRIGPRHFQNSSLVWGFLSSEMLVGEDSMNAHPMNCISEALFSFYSSRFVLFLHVHSIIHQNTHASKTSALDRLFFLWLPGLQPAEM